MEGLILLAQGLPYFTEISTVITVSSIITMALKDKYAEKLPILKTIWPIINWLHNQNNSEGMQKDKKKK